MCSNCVSVRERTNTLVADQRAQPSFSDSTQSFKPAVLRRDGDCNGLSITGTKGNSFLITMEVKYLPLNAHAR